MRIVLILCGMLLLVGCKSGPAVDCSGDPSAEATAQGPFSQAAAAAAEGGQRASNQPTMIDPGARAIYTPINRGTGPLTTTTTATESRSQAGAPSVNQGLVLPTSADASTGGGVSPVVASLQSQLTMLQSSMQLALLTPGTPPERLTFLSEQINATVSAMAQAQAAMVSNVHNTYNLQGARIVQSVANGSKAGDGDAGAIDAAAAKAVGAPLLDAAKAALEGPDSPDAGSFPAPAPVDGGGPNG